MNVEDNKEYLGVILTKSFIKANKKINATLKTMKLKTINKFLVLENTENNRGQIKKVRNYVSWGFLSDTQATKIRKVLNSNQKRFCSPYKGLGSEKRTGYNSNFFNFLQEKYILRKAIVV